MIPEPPAPPRRVLIAGDWHGNTSWALDVISRAARLLDGEDPRLILHLGDFGLWPGGAGERYLRNLQADCDRHGVLIRFIDGNHDDATQLESLRIDEACYYGGVAPVAWIPRGFRWWWHGRTWLALGGGVSLDRAIRKEGASWWPEEEVTDDQAAKVIAGGPADVMLAHDCPAGVRHSFPPPPPFWDARDLARSDVHRERLQRVVDAVRPRWLAHGHLHRSYKRDVDFGYGPVEVTGLDCGEGDGANYAVLDVKDMKWEASA